MAKCLPTSVALYLQAECGDTAFLSPQEASSIFSVFLDLFGWTDQRLSVQEGKSWSYQIFLHQTLQTTIARSRLARCSLKGNHNCNEISVFKRIYSKPSLGWNLCKKHVIDELRTSIRNLIPTIQMDVQDSEATVLESGNTQIKETHAVEVSEPVEPEKDFIDISNTSQNFKFESILNRNILFDQVDVSGISSKHWMFPDCIKDKSCAPNVLPLETMMYGTYDIQIIAKLNAHKFTQGLMYVSVLPDPILLDPIYDASYTPYQRLGGWINCADSNSVVIDVPFEYRRAFVRNISRASQFAGSECASLFKLSLNVLVKVESGTGMDIKATMSLFFSFKDATLAGMALNVPLQQGPIAQITRPYKTFTGAVNAIDNLLDEADSFIGGDKPVNMLNVISTVPKPRMFFPNGRGMSDASIMRLDPTSCTRINSRIDSEIKTLGHIARIWGVLGKWEWTSGNKAGDVIFELPLDPTCLIENAKVLTIGTLPPVCWVTSINSMYNGPLEFMVRVVSTNFHSGSLSIHYEYGRNPSVDSDVACQPFAYQFETFDLGTTTEFSFEAPYIYDTPWRRTTNLQANMSHGYGFAVEDRTTSSSIKMANEGHIEVRVLNPLKAADTVKNSVTLVVFVRAAKGFNVVGPTRNSQFLTGGLSSREALMGRVQDRHRIKSSYVPFEKSPLNPKPHPSLSQFRESTLRAGDVLVSVKKSTKINEAKLHRLETTQQQLTQVQQELEARKVQLSKCIVDKQVLQADTISTKIRELELENLAYRGYLTQPTYNAGHGSYAGNYARSTDALVGSKILFQKIRTSFPWKELQVGSDPWEFVKLHGGLYKEINWKMVPRPQAPTKQYNSKDTTVNFPRDIFVKSGNFEELKLLDILRRPLLLLMGAKVKASLQYKDMPAGTTKDDIYHSYAIPITPPQFTHVDPAEGPDMWDGSILSSPQIAITSLFRHWVGSNRYTIIVRSETFGPVYVTYVPNTGVIYFGDIAGKVVLPATNPHKRGGIPSLGLITEIISPPINPSAVIEVPFFSPNVVATLNSNDYSTHGPLRDRSDSIVGHLLITSYEDITVDVWWEFGVDAGLGSFIGVPQTLPISLGGLPDDNGPLYSQGFRPRAVLPSGDVPVQQMMSSICQTADIFIKYAGLKTFFNISTGVTSISANTMSTLESVSRAANSFQNSNTIFVDVVGDIGTSIDNAITRTELSVKEYLPHISTSGLVLTSVMDMWALYKDCNPVWVANVVGRWLVTCGLLTVKTLTHSMSALLAYFKQVFLPSQQSFTSVAQYLIEFLKTVPKLVPVFKISGFAGFLDRLFSTHRIFRISWGIRLFENCVTFLKYLVGIINRIIYWYTGRTDPKKRIYYMLTDRGAELENFVRKMQYFLKPEVKAIVKVSPKDKAEFYTTLYVAYQVQTIMVTLPPKERNPLLNTIIHDFVKRAHEFSQSLMTAPVRYEPYMIKMYGKTAVGKSFVATDLINKLLASVNVKPVGKTILGRTCGQEFWTDVDGYECAVLVDEAGQINTPEANTGLIADTFILKTPNKCNPNQASEDKKDRCINPILAVFLCNDPSPHMNELRCEEAFSRRFEVQIEVSAKTNLPKDHEFNHIRMHITHRNGKVEQSHRDLNYEQAYTVLVEWFKDYHKTEVQNVRWKTESLLKSLRMENHERFLTTDPYSVYYRHLYGVESTSNVLATAEMELMMGKWLESENYQSPYDFVFSQAPNDTTNVMYYKGKRADLPSTSNDPNSMEFRYNFSNFKTEDAELLDLQVKFEKVRKGEWAGITKADAVRLMKKYEHEAITRMFKEKFNKGTQPTPNRPRGPCNWSGFFGEDGPLSRIMSRIAAIQETYTNDIGDGISLLYLSSCVMFMQMYQVCEDFTTGNLMKTLGILSSDCEICKATSVECVPLCHDELCGYDVCLTCIMSKDYIPKACPSCGELDDNIRSKVPGAKLFAVIATTLVDVFKVPLTCAMAIVWELFTFVVFTIPFALPSVVILLFEAPFIISGPISLSLLALRYWIDPNASMFTYLPCHVWHRLKAGSRMIKVGARYLCDLCSGDGPRARPSQQAPPVIQSEIEIILSRISEDDWLRNRRAPGKPVGLVDGKCRHYRMMQELGDISSWYYTNRKWRKQEIGSYLELPNTPCKNCNCPLLDPQFVTELIDTAFISNYSFEALIGLLEIGSEDSIPYQLLDHDVSGWFSVKRDAIHDFFQQFSLKNWWDWLPDWAQIMAKFVAVASAITFILCALKKIWDWFYPDPTSIEEPIDTTDLLEEVLEQSRDSYHDGKYTRSGAARRVFRGKVRKPVQIQSATNRPLTSIMGASLSNTGKILVSDVLGDKELIFFGIFDRYCLMPYHFHKMLRRAQNLVLTRHNSDIAVPYSFSESDFIRDGENDMMMMRMPPQYPKFKDLRKHLSDDRYFEKNFVRSDGYILVPQLKHMPTAILNNLKLSEVVSEVSTQDPKGELGLALDCIKYNFSLPGACGSVVFQNADVKPIVGIHVAGVGEKLRGCGYAVILGLQSIDNMIGYFNDKEIPTIQCSPELFKDAEDITTTLSNMNVHLIGGIEKHMALNQPAESQIVPSLIKPFLNRESLTVPAPLSRKHPTYKDHVEGPFMAGIRHMGECPYDIDTETAEEIGKATALIISPMRPSVVSPRKLTVDEAVVGFGVDYYDRIALNTSPGFPYNKMSFCDGTKKSFIDIDDAGKVTMHDVLTSNLQKNEKIRCQGIMADTKFVDVMKDERRPPDKISKPGSTRIVSMSPLCFTIAFRQIYLHFMAAFMNYRLELPHAVGINPDGPEWSILYDKLRSKNEKDVWTIDYKNFGPGLSTRAAWWCYKIFYKWTLENVKGVNPVEAWVLCQELITSRHIAHDAVYDQVCGSPSGSPSTVIINTLVNWYYILLAFKKISQKQAKVKYLVQEKGLCGAFLHCCAYVAYGDDGIGATLPEYSDFINTSTIVHELSFYNICATSSDKNKILSSSTPFSKGEFLKRGFLEHPTRENMVLAPLRLNSVYDTAMWIHNKADAITATNEVVAASLLNAYSRGPKFYEKWYGELIKAANECDITVPPWTWLDIDNKHFAPHEQAIYKIHHTGAFHWSPISDNFDFTSDSDEIPTFSAPIREEFLKQLLPPRKTRVLRKIKS